jgi:threonine/homoserine/homoserine lactone efflux protein
MVETSTLLVFLLAAFALLVVPGPSVLYVVARGVAQGRAAGFVSALGVGTGALVHVAAAAVGLSALLVASSVAFAAVKYLGAAYLIYLGLRTLLARETDGRPPTIETRGLRRVFAQGAVVEALNPKTALFFLAFLPQFVDPGRGSVAGQTLLLGALFVALGVCTDGIYALAAGTAGGWLRARLGRSPAQRYVTGTIYLGLGVSTALAGADRE